MLAFLLAACRDPVALGTDTGLKDPDDTVPTVVSSTPCDACGGDCLLEELSYPQRYHVTGGVDYADTPPAGGPHDPCWATFGVHPEAVADEHWVHNLEHGAVVFLHDCEDCTAEVAALEALTRTSPWALSTPYAMETPFAAVAWQVRLTTGCWDPPTMEAFLAEQVDHGPESTNSAPSDGCM